MMSTQGSGTSRPQKQDNMVGLFIIVGATEMLSQPGLLAVRISSTQRGGANLNRLFDPLRFGVHVPHKARIRKKSTFSSQLSQLPANLIPNSYDVVEQAQRRRGTDPFECLLQRLATSSTGITTRSNTSHVLWGVGRWTLWMLHAHGAQLLHGDILSVYLASPDRESSWSDVIWNNTHHLPGDRARAWVFLELDDLRDQQSFLRLVLL